MCERWVEKVIDCYMDPSSSLDHSSTSSAYWLGSLRAVALNMQAGPHSGIPISDLLYGRRHLSIFFHNAHLLPLFFCLFTQVHLLNDGSVKGQYITRRCPWCNGYRRRKWTRRYEFKFCLRLVAFHIALIPLGKVWIQIFSLKLWVNSWAD